MVLENPEIPTPVAAIPRTGWNFGGIDCKPTNMVDQPVFLYERPTQIYGEGSVIHAMILCLPDPDDPDLTRDIVQTTIHHFRSPATGIRLAETATAHRRAHHPVAAGMFLRQFLSRLRKRDVMVHTENWIARSTFSEYTLGKDPAVLDLRRLSKNRTLGSHRPESLLTPSTERMVEAFDAHYKKKMEVLDSLLDYRRKYPDDDLAKLAE